MTMRFQKENIFVVAYVPTIVTYEYKDIILLSPEPYFTLRTLF